MTLKEIKDTEKRVSDFLAERRLRDAFSYIKNVAEGTMNYEVTDRIKRVEQTYAYMLSYLTAGADDPQRDKVLNDIVAETYECLDMLVIAVKQVETPTLYYNVRRFAQRNSSASSLSNTILRWTQARRRATSLSSLYENASTAQGNSESNALESAEVELFNRIWTSFPMSAENARSLVQIVTDPDVPKSTAVRITSAIGLAANEFADRQPIEVLCDIYSALAKGATDRERAIASTALVALVIVLFKYSSRTFYNSTINRLEALRDLKTWNSDLKVVFMELVRSRDTERINRTMNNQIIPEMMALRPEIEKKLRDINVAPQSIEDFERNPEWEELLAKSGIEGKLRELNELQMEGSDVFMSTFAHLKNFPFFNEVINWFTPMDSDSVEVEKILNSNPTLQDVISLIERVPFLCDSDKFSMILSVGMLPTEQRNMMLSQINAQSEQLDNIRSELVGITDSDIRRSDVRNYLRNLYRFLNLFRRKSEFYNVFDKDVNLLTIPLIEEDLRDADLLRLIGEFYFKRGYYDDALKAFLTLDAMNEFDATLYQKIGYAYEHTGNLESALRFYEQADLLDSESRWLKIKLANMYRATGRISEAIALLTSMADKNAADAEVELMLGYLYVREENYREALRRFYKVEFMEEDKESTKSLRPIAWSLFMVGDFDKSADYYSRILMDQPTGEDYLNMGHVALGRSMFKEAINYYKLYILAAGNDKEAFFKALETDRCHLEYVGINKNTISLIADAMLYDLD